MVVDAHVTETSTPCTKGNVNRACSRLGLGQARYLVVIGQRVKLDPVRSRTLDHFARRQQAIGYGGVGVKVCRNQARRMFLHRHRGILAVGCFDPARMEVDDGARHALRLVVMDHVAGITR